MYAGLSLNGDVTPEDQLQQFIDSALEEIEFIRGPADSKWGSVRAKLGHPEPWKLEYVEVGNEDWLAGAPEGWNTYMEYRFPLFLEAINEAWYVFAILPLHCPAFSAVPLSVLKADSFEVSKGHLASRWNAWLPGSNNGFGPDF